jgi:multiple sugar transport system ATP-binding protein
MTLVLKNLTKDFPGVRAVDDLSLDAADGELLVLTGPSGCGKTTVLRLIAGLERPSGGSIAIDGRPVAGLPPRRRDVAMVFQQGALYPHLSVYGNLAFGLRLRGESRIEIDRRVREAAEMLDIAELLTRRPGELSGGQQRRVALGRAIVRRPRLFLFDEPLESLDAGLRGQLRQEIRRLHQRLRITAVYVTHDQTEAMSLGERIAVLRAGRLEQAADPQTLYAQPVNRFVAAAIGAPPMSFVAGRIEGCDAGLAFVATTGDAQLQWPIPESRAAELQVYLGKPILLGIRPEHLALEANAGTALRSFRPTAAPEHERRPEQSLAQFRQQPGSHHAERDEYGVGVVEAIERLGPFWLVEVLVGAVRLGIRVLPGATIASGQQVAVAAAMEQAHFFDPVTERRVGY